MQKQMHVGVNEAWQQSRIAQIDEICTGRMAYGGAHFRDALAAY
jgi:hypothetical protein